MCMCLVCMRGEREGGKEERNRFLPFSSCAYRVVGFSGHCVQVKGCVGRLVEGCALDGWWDEGLYWTVGGGLLVGL
jgi:hypothetical protein